LRFRHYAQVSDAHFSQLIQAAKEGHGFGGRALIKKIKKVCSFFFRDFIDLTLLPSLRVALPAPPSKPYSSAARGLDE
jgi:hypothetical protein